MLKQNSEYLKKENTNCLKGILSICVLICHLWGSLAQANPNIANEFWGRIMGVIFMSFGYLSVSLFFFLSGYGLMIQYKKHGHLYIKTFLKRRILPLYLLCICLIIFYWGARVAFGERVLPYEILQSFLFGGTIISKGWYLQSILIWYLLFYICFLIFKKEKHQHLALIGAFVFYIILCNVLKLDNTWYECAFCLPIGIFWASKQEKLDCYLNQNKNYIIFTLIALLSFACTFVLGNLAPIPFIPKIIIKCISSNIFVIAVVLILKLISTQNLITRFLGGIYLEIYVIHGFVLMLFHSKYIYINNGLVYSLAVISTSILLAWSVTPIFKKILQIGKGNKHGAKV